MPEIVTSRDAIYLNGRWTASRGDAVLGVENPATERIVGHVPAGTAEDVDAAVRAARGSLSEWGTSGSAERADVLRRLHQAVEKRADEFAATIATEVGCPIRVATKVQTGTPLRVLESCVELAGFYPLSEPMGNSLIVREPVGVVGAITPWNYPLQQLVAKVGPALAAGCSVVVKPSELAPLTAYLFFDALDEIGLPPGVVNLVPGTGSEAGAALVAHDDVDMVSFTGSTVTGRKVAATAGERLAKVALELGGKSANIILDDADLTAAVKVGVAKAFLNSGQTCTAWTRMVVDRSRYDEAVTLAAEAASKYTMGDPFDEGTRLGPLVSGPQRDRALSYVAGAVADGARVVAGGPEAAVPSSGYFVAPTVFADVDPDSVLAQEEVFGPVLAMIPVSGEDEAVEVANNSTYGLAGGVWSADAGRALAVARRLQTGGVDINGGAFNPMAPFGGYKQSGIGRELGPYGIEEFLQLKAIQQ
jgi:aldehyde dehydrogenase (NAD+)